MKKLLITLSILITGALLALPFFNVAQAHSLVQTVSGNGGGYVNTYNISITPSSSSDTLILVITMGTADLPTITDNQTNHWVLRQSADDGTGQRKTQTYTEDAPAAAATTITVTFQSGDSADSAYILREWSGLQNPAYDTGGIGTEASGNTSHSATASTTNATANELIVGGGGCANTNSPTSTAGTGFSDGLQQQGFDIYTWDFAEDAATTSIGISSASWNTVASAICETNVTTYKDVPTNPATFQINGQTSINAQTNME